MQFDTKLEVLLILSTKANFKGCLFKSIRNKYIEN